MGMESFGGGKKIDNTKAGADKPREDVVTRTEVEISGGVFYERFSDGTYSSMPVKGFQKDGHERVSVEVDKSDPKNPMVLERFADGTYSKLPVESIKV